MTNLVSVDDVKALLPIRQSNSSYDAKIKGLIATATQEIETTCRQSFAKAVRTEFHTSRLNHRSQYDFGGWSETATRVAVEEQAILLRASPLDVSAGVKVWYDPSRRFGDTDLLGEGDFFLDPDPTLSRVLIAIPTIHREYAFKIEYTAGYAEANGSLSAALDEHAPTLKKACIDTVVYLFNQTSDSADAEKSSQFTNSRVIPPNAMTLLSPYRRILTGRG